MWISVPGRDGQHRYQSNGYLFAGPGHLDLQLQDARPTPDRLELRVTASTEDFDPRPLPNGRRLLRPQPPPKGGRVELLVWLRDLRLDESRLLERSQIAPFFDEHRIAVALPKDLALRHQEIRVELRPDPGTRALLTGLLAYRSTTHPTRVLLVSLDTHGLQNMSLAGEREIDTSPSLRRLLHDEEAAVAFTRAIGAGDWTLPTHGSVFTGLYPSQHGLHDRGPVQQELHPNVVLLQEILRRSGVTTIQLVSHIRIASGHGYHRGIDHHRLYDEPLGDRGRRVLDDAVDLIEAARDRDLFAFIHIYDAHVPYTNYPSDYASLVGDVEPHYPEELYLGPVNREQIIAGHGWRPELRSQNIERFGELILPQMPAARTAYRLGMRDVDDMIGEFIETLRARDLWRDTTVIFFSDHGEEFFEHGTLMHLSLFQQIVNVPLLVRLADGARHRGLATRSSKVVPHVFEAHTTLFQVLLDLYDLAPPDYVSSADTHALGLQDLLTLDRSHLAFSEQLTAPRDSYYEASLLTLDGRQVLLSTLLGPDGGWQDAEEKLRIYDVGEDPGNLHDLVGKDADTSQSLRDALRRKIESVQSLRFEAKFEAELSEEEQERLRALGYL